MRAAQTGSFVGDRYLICDLIGEGGMGRVFRAEQTALERTVAVKFLRPDLARDPEQVRRFHAEARAASLISHPNTVAVIDVGTSAAGEHFLVMEYVRGSNLSEVLHREGPLAIDRVLAVADQILSVLEVLHAAGVVHADIKSDNILLEEAGAHDERVRLIDFGLARVLWSDQTPGSADAVVSGTAEYIAPEVIRGQPPTPAADIYAVGIVLFELLTGATPFAGGSPVQVLERHLSAPALPPSLRRPDRPIPPALERVAMRALAKSTEDRFADASSFRAALAAVRARLDPQLLVLPAREICSGLSARQDAETQDWRPTDVELVA